MNDMKTSDRWVLTVVTENGLHTKIAYGSYQEFEATQDAVKAALVPGVARASVDLIRNWSGRRVTRVWV
jgi:hypothetical protein